MHSLEEGKGIDDPKVHNKSIKNNENITLNESERNTYPEMIVFYGLSTVA